MRVIAKQLSRRLAGLLLMVATAAAVAPANAQELANDPRIVGGSPVTDGRYPFMASLNFDIEGTWQAVCGGTVIDPSWVLTAAHCVVNPNTDETLPASFMRLQIGAEDISGNDGVFRDIASVRVHPRYASGTFQYDIALIELSAPVNVPVVALAGIGNDDPINNESAVVTGWGNTSEGGTPSSQLLDVELPIVPFSECFPSYSTVLQRDIHICAGGQPEGGRSSCQGDSGGPLMFRRNGNLVQIGVVSFGVGCARPSIPGVYARVSTFSAWIQGFVPGAIFVGDTGGETPPDDGNDPQVVFLEPGVVLSNSVLIGDADLYEVSPSGTVELTTLSGNADMLVVVGTNFTEDDVTCISQNTTAVDTCDSPATDQRVFVIVYGTESSDYQLTYTPDGGGGGGGSGESTLIALPPGSVASGDVVEGDFVLYDVTGANRVDLETLAGDADLYIYEGADVSTAQLTCDSVNETALDSCDVVGDSAVSIALVAGYVDSTYEVTSVGGQAQTDAIALPPGTVVTGNVGLEGVVAYDVTGAGRVELETFSGDADLYVYEGQSLETLELTCTSVESTALDACAVLGTSALSIALVYGYAASDYQISAFGDDVGPDEEEPGEVTILPLPAGSIVNDSVAAGEFVFYDVTSVGRVDLQSLSGDADLVLLEGPSLNTVEATCISQSATALDSCDVTAGSPVSIAAVYGYSDASYQIEAVAMGPIVVVDPERPGQPGPDQPGPDTPDPDNPFEVVEPADDDATGGGGGGGGGGALAAPALLMLMGIAWSRRRRRV